MVTVTVNIPEEINKEIEHFKIENDLKDKRDAIVLLLKQCVITQKTNNMEDIFKEVDKMKRIKLSANDLVRMKREVYEQ